MSAQRKAHAADVLRIDKVQCLEEIDAAHYVPSVLADDGSLRVPFVESPRLQRLLTRLDRLAVGQQIDAQAHIPVAGEMKAIRPAPFA